MPYIISAIILAVVSCTKPFVPKGIKPITGYLVVEGVINAGNDTTRFRLSRTVALDSVTSSAPVTGAVVNIEGSDNSSHQLTGNTAGVYITTALNLNTSQKYRLHITTADGKDYTSDYVAVKITPPIDSINYQVKNTGLQINLNAHDPSNNTRYYRWDYNETWEFHSMYASSYISNGDTVIERSPAQQIYFCYQSDASNNILLGSPAKLSQDVISSAPITFIPSNSEKVETEYSILVSQYALTSDAYNFWTNLKKNTEELGSIFDAQPSTVDGNIHCNTNPAEPVLGYVSASTVQSKRIFVSNLILPITWRPSYPYTCELDSFLFSKKIGGIFVNQENQVFNYNKGAARNGTIPVEAIVIIGGVTIGHTGSDRECVDCSVRGSLTKPSFWP